MNFEKRNLTPKVYPSPRMSVNQLGEYITASASRRNAIIKDSRIVPVYIAKRYNLASAIVSDFLASDSETIDSLHQQMLHIKHKDYTTPNEKAMSLFSLEALMSFTSHAMSVKNCFNKSKLEPANNFSYHKMELEGVEVSIRPEIIIKDRNNKIVGFVKLYFSKNNELSQERGDFITCLGRTYFSDTHHITLPERNCLVLDVFTGELISAPKAFKRRMLDISASCREIADRWHRFN